MTMRMRLAVLALGALEAAWALLVAFSASTYQEVVCWDRSPSGIAGFALVAAGFLGCCAVALAPRMSPGRGALAALAALGAGAAGAILVTSADGAWGTACL